MKKLITALLLLISISASAQTWTNFNAYGLQRKVAGSDTTWRFAGSIGNGFRTFNPNPSGGSADSSTFRTNANSYSLAGMQTKLNLYVLQTRLVSTSNGVLGGGNLGSNLSLSSDTTYNRTVANSLTLAQLQTKFNTKQETITLTTTGSSGAATLIGNVLNIPQYTGGGGGSVTSVTSANADIGVASPTTTPVLTLNSSTSGSNNTIAKRNGSGNLFVNAILGFQSSSNLILSDTYDMYFKTGSSGTGDFYWKSNNDITEAMKLTYQGNLSILGGFTLGNTLLGTAGVFSGSVSVQDEAYDASTWNSNLTAPTKNAIRDKIESMSSGGVSSVAAGLGMSFTTITSTGSVAADTTVLRTVANSFTKAQAQPRITLTTTGTSGAATLIGTTLNIPNYATGGSQDLASVLAQGNNGGEASSMYVAYIESDINTTGSTKSREYWGNIIIRTTNNTLSVSDYTVLGDASSGAITLTLPTAASAYDSSLGVGRIFTVKKIDSSGNSVTLKGNGSELIDASNTSVINTQWSSIMVQSNGSQWFIL